MIKFEDTKGPIELVKRQGYFRVGSKYFLYKYNALVESAHTGSPLSWNFNDEVFTRVDWTKPSGLSLQGIYKQRAQQLRDKYSYLILSYSGGADSHNMLQAFIDNDIRVDEVWVDWPFTMMNVAGFTPSRAKEFINLPSEWEFAIKPQLDMLKNRFPNIKIHVSDASADANVDDFEDTGFFLDMPRSYVIARRSRYIYRYMDKITNRGGFPALVMGVDKPIFQIKGDYLGVVFGDTGVMQKTDIVGSNRRDIEYFYWTPDMPHVVIDQAHAFIRYLRHKPHLIEENKEHLLTLKHTKTRALSMNDHINAVCYPRWDGLTFQTDKNGPTHFEEAQFHGIMLNFRHKFFDFYKHRYVGDVAALSSSFQNSGALFDPRRGVYNTYSKHPISLKFYPVIKVSSLLENTNV